MIKILSEPVFLLALTNVPLTFFTFERLTNINKEPEGKLLTFGLRKGWASLRSAVSGALRAPPARTLFSGSNPC